MSDAASRGGMDYAAAFFVPVLCIVASVFINILLATAGVIEPAALTGTPPAVLDVGLQLIFLTAGAIITIGNAKNETGASYDNLKAKALAPMIACFLALCLVLGSLAIAQQTWSWVAEWKGWLRVGVPNLAGAGTVGFCVWNLRASR